MTIIDNTKPLPPILEWKPKPDFRTTLEKQNYWASEKKKWIEGVGNIPGSLYHKTQEQWIKDRNAGNIFRPQCRDVDLLIHQEIVSCRKAGEALIIIKGRGVGLSSEMGTLANYFMKVYPGTTTLLTSEAQSKISSLFSEKVAVVFDNYDDDIKPVEVNRNETKNSSYLKVEQVYLDENGKQRTNTSQIICRDTSDTPASASAFSGQGAIFGAYDELFLHKRRTELIRSSAPCYMDARTKQTTGFLLAGGTIEDTLSNEQLAELQKLIEEVQENGRLGTMKARLLFIPSWMGSFMTNGHSDEKKAMEWWHKEIEQLEKLKDPKALRAFKMNNPMRLDDIFELSKGDRFEDDVSDKIKLQHKFILANPQPIQKAKIVDNNGTPTKILDKKGNIEILEDPRPNVEYYLCIDGVATGKKTGGDKGSNVAGTVVKMFDTGDLKYAPIAIYSERPDTIEQSYYTLVAIANYYNQFGSLKGIMAEANASTADHFSTFLTKMGLSRFIMSTQDLSGKGFSNTKKAFQYITDSARDFQMRQANIYLRKYISNIRFQSLLQDMMKPASENADILDSWLMFFIAAKDYDKPYSPPKPKQTRQIQTVIQSPDGSWKTIWKEV